MSQASETSPTVPPPRPDGLSPTLARNIAALRRHRRRSRDREGLETHLADRITGFAGSMTFVYVHLGVLAAWVCANLRLIPGLHPFDATFVILATAASVEAIFLSTFVLISQNRAAAAADERADLDLQINLLAEHEVTRLITLVAAIGRKLEIDDALSDDLHELERDVAPEAVLNEMDDRSES